MFTFRHIENEIEYDGKQLTPHWIYKNFDIIDDSMVSFIGECNVVLENMIDIADVKSNAPIYSPKMLHFIAEFFDDDLQLMIARQRLFIVTIKEELEDKSIPGKIIRRGDDLFHIGVAGMRRKLSVSIATKSVTSTLMHVGLNIHTQGTPVPTAGLHELGVDPASFAARVMERFDRELESMSAARCKVRAV